MTGGVEMRNKLTSLRRRFPNAVASALYIEGQLMATEAKKRTPVDTGALRGTIHVVGPNKEQNHIYVLIVAGGPSAPYAIYVHEDTSANHSSPPFGGGQAKFIESVIDESRPSLLSRVAARANVETAMEFEEE